MTSTSCSTGTGDPGSANPVAVPPVVGTAPATTAAPFPAGAAWRLLGLLFVVNTLNFHDRALPGVLAAPLRSAFDLQDTQLGLLSTLATLVYAVAGVGFGRMADQVSRRKVIAGGLFAWSLFTALSGGAWSFTSLVVAQAGMGVGQATFTPAATAVIADLFEPHRRSRAIGIFQLGLPVGTLVAFFSAGALAEAFDSFRAPFLLAALPGFVVALLVWRSPEPPRGANDRSVGDRSVGDRAASDRSAGDEPLERPFATVLSVPTMRWLIVAGIGVTISASAVGAFLVLYVQLYFGYSLGTAALVCGIVLGATGIAGLLLSGWVADRASRHSARRRLLVGAGFLGVAAPLAFAAFAQPPGAGVAFAVLLSIAWALQFVFHTTSYPAAAYVVLPRLRAAAMSGFFAAFYLLGGAFGPLLVGVVSDRVAAASSSGALAPGVTAHAAGLQGSLLAVVPLSLALGAVGLLLAASTIDADRRGMVAQLGRERST